MIELARPKRLTPILFLLRVSTIDSTDRNFIGGGSWIMGPRLFIILGFFFELFIILFSILFGIHSSLFHERKPDFSLLDSMSGLIHDYIFDYKYHSVASYHTLLPHRATHGDLFFKLSWCCIFRCYGHYYHYYHNVIFALTETRRSRSVNSGFVSSVLLEHSPLDSLA